VSPVAFFGSLDDSVPAACGERLCLTPLRMSSLIAHVDHRV